MHVFQDIFVACLLIDVTLPTQERSQGDFIIFRNYSGLLSLIPPPAAR
jgi:hypothetical protein